VFSLGHRNPQGFDWRPGTDELVASEHGPEGNDEINLLSEGDNYGWPEVVGRDHGDFRAPAVVYEDTIAPSGATFVSRPRSAWSGDFMVAALAGEQIRRLTFDADGAVTRDEGLFEDDFGRLRTVVEGPDGALYVLTSNLDGRGAPRDGDDRVLRIVPPGA
jgi:glucose/arabinose dehydrogenase